MTAEFVIQSDHFGEQMMEIQKQIGEMTGEAVLESYDDQIWKEEARGLKVLGRETRVVMMERMLASLASQTYDKSKLAECTLYTTVEPCPMCTGAIYWANIGCIVFGITEEKLLEMTGSDEKNPTFNMGAAKVIQAGQKKINLLGPFPNIEEEIVALHLRFWKK